MSSTYEIGECIFEGVRSQVFRARRRADGMPVVLKRIRAPHPTRAQLAALVREHDITSVAAGDGVIAAYELHPEEGLVVEDFGARSVAQVLRERRLSLEETLSIAVQITGALSRVHRLDVVHRDVNPSNVVLNETTGVAKLIDFGIAQVLTRENAASFEGTPRYVSPEQTGRMNRPVDHRSDLYSLGVTLYELLTGSLPFDARDRLELVHAHIARAPIPPHEVDPRVPVELSRVVLTLLQKEADQRYRSARGLRHDLERCLERLRDGGRARAFEPRQRDVDERLRFPNVLYGREREVAALADACADAESGAVRACFFAGEAGIGKTSLVRECRRLLAGGRARIVEGKYDAFDRGRPYAGLVQAFASLSRQILADSDEAVRDARARIAEGVGRNAAVLVDLVPELAAVVGEQLSPDPLPPAESKNRLHLAVAALVRAVATPPRPLVLFLDDLQWADLASFEVLERIARDPELSHVLFIGAYRDKEVDEDHPLVATIRAIEATRRVDRTLLGPLREDDVARFVADVVRSAPGHLRLASACHDRTRGNVFHLSRFLESLSQDAALSFDPEEWIWRWDLAAIAARPVTDNVVDLLADRIRRLPERPRACLLDAAAVGYAFDLDGLAAARGSTRKETLEALGEAIRAELVLPEAEGFWYVRAVDETHTNFVWRFAHDRIRQTAHELLDPDRARLVHLRVARHLLERLSPLDVEQRAFELVAHLDLAWESLAPDERIRLEEISLVAARRALASAAFGTAHAILRSAIARVDERAWGERRSSTMALHLEGARAAWLAGDAETTERLLEVARERARDLLERVAVSEIEIDARIGRQRFAEGISAALAILEELGVPFPAAPVDADAAGAIGAALAAVKESGPERIVALPEIDDARVAAAMRIQNAIMSVTYLARPKLFPLLTASIVRMTLAHGVTRQSPYGLAVFAIVLNAIGLIDVARMVGDAAAKLLDRWDDASVRTRTEHVLHHQVRGFTHPLRALLEPQARVFRLGMDAGDLEYATWGLHAIACNGFYAGLDLADIGARIDRHVATMRQHEQMPALACTAPYQQLVRNLVGDAADPAKLVGPDFDETRAMAEHRAVDFRGAACVVTAAAMFARFVFRDLEGALAVADAGADVLDGAASTYHVVWWHQYRALGHLGLGRPPQEVAPSLAQLEAWLAFSPENHRHRVELVRAEIARVEGRVADAIDAYDAAIRHARQNGFLHEQALANELAGRFHRSRGSDTPARAYLLEARWVWHRWGATAKVTQLDREFADLLVLRVSTSTGATTATTTTMTDTVVGLDLDTLFKAASAISSEIHLDRLLARVLDVAIENAGATRGLLLFDGGGELSVAACRAVDRAAEIAPGTRLEACPPIVARVLAYVARSGNSVLAPDVRDDPAWQRGDRLDRATSVLAVPMTHKGARLGIVYLENDLAAGAFGPERHQLVSLLAAQAAISIENARLYRNLESSLEKQVRLTHAHRRFVPHPFLESLAKKDITEITLGDSVRKEMSILFADMRGFTRFVAGMSGKEAIELVNGWLGRMEPPVQRHGGFVDSYVGDAIMALFDDADGAIQAALGMVAALPELNHGRAVPIAFGVGIDTGELTLGTIGSENRVKCGVIGDCVNVASRVESLTRTYETQLLTTERTRARLRRRYDLRFVDRVVVKGHTDAISLYEVFDGDPLEVREAKRRVATRHDLAATAYYARDFARAKALFDECRAELPGDPVVASFVERCDRNVASPPADDWNGVEVLAHK